MSKRVFIVHGWGGSPDDHWLPWLRQMLEKQKFEAYAPQMPNTDEPDITEWVTTLAAEVGHLTDSTFFIGHSIGSQAIMRYLEGQAGKRAGGCVFVAGWFKLENLPAVEVPIAQPWQEMPIDFEKVLSVTDKFTVFISDNDDYDAVEENARLFRQNLKADVHILHKKGHFTASDGVIQLPGVLEAVLKHSKDS